MSLPDPTKGPYSLDMGALVQQATATVLSRDDIVTQVDELGVQLNLEKVVADQRATITAAVEEQVSRCLETSAWLHNQLVDQLAGKGNQVQELQALAQGVRSLRDSIRRLEKGNPETAHQLRMNKQLLERAMNRQATGLDGDPDGVLEPELARCRTLLAQAEVRQVGLLELVLPQALELRPFRAMVTEWEAQKRELVQSLEIVVLSVALTALNTASTEQSATRMKVRSFDGLRASMTTERIVLTDAYRELEEKIGQRNEGSFGVAGPRGVGKSTLISYFASVRPREFIVGEGDQRLGVVVSAPVAYDPREFVLHLYSELCQAVIGGRAEKPAVPEPAPTVSRIVNDLRARAAIGAAALTGGAGLLVLAVRARLPWSWNVLADSGAAAIVLAAVVLAVALCRPRLWGGPVVEHPVVRVQGNSVTMGGPRNVRRVSAWGPAVTAAVTVTGLILFIVGGGWRGGTLLFFMGTGLTAVGIPALWWAWRQYRSLLSTTHHGLDELLLQLEPLRDLAVNHLRQIRYQQSFSRERSMAVKIGGPVGADLGGKLGDTWQERPKTYPEIVNDLRAFLIAVAENYTVMIGVDELDKMRSYEEVENFLNDIKGVFGATGTFFLVSVSEDAAASFERRGAPFRDVFDSAFDDVISVRHLDLASSRKVLYGLLLGWTKPFVGLCYVLSGGLARDLWRTARDLIACRDDGDSIELSAAVTAMCRRECGARVGAIQHELMREPHNPANIELLTRVLDLVPAKATASTMRELHEQLHQTSAGSAGAAANLGLELAAFLLFAATVIEFFDPSAPADRIRVAEKADEGASGLSTLALARQKLAQSPGISLAYTRRFRAAWGLD